MDLEFKGTKGKWYLQEFTDAYTNIVRCDNGKGFETLYIGATGHNTDPKTRADARLMAAAPDMLNALTNLIETYEEKGQLLSYDVNIARQAISKALEKTE